MQGPAHWASNLQNVDVMKAQGGGRYRECKYWVPRAMNKTL